MLERIELTFCRIVPQAVYKSRFKANPDFYFNDQLKTRLPDRAQKTRYLYTATEECGSRKQSISLHVERKS